MTVTFDTVLQNALLLPVEDRSRIAARQIESVDAADDSELSPAWCAEIDRRIEVA
ncbi:MAG: hypothetical protein JWR15_4205, partial [Prosthecobacter sp.]|nr:hypothetical protein [Prosthecobacter sp.]